MERLKFNIIFGIVFNFLEIFFQALISRFFYVKNTDWTDLKSGEWKEESSTFNDKKKWNVGFGKTKGQGSRFKVKRLMFGFGVLLSV